MSGFEGDCFACGRPMKIALDMAMTSDGAQRVYVGPDCARLIRRAGEAGYQPVRGGPRLYDLDELSDHCEPDGSPCRCHVHAALREAARQEGRDE